MLFAQNDWNGMAALAQAVFGGLIGLLGAIGVLIPILLSLRKKDETQQVEIDQLKRGQYMRGFVGAEREGMITYNAVGRRVIAPEWREKLDPLFEEKKAGLKKLRKNLRFRLGREPSEFELADEIERTHQDWLIESVCRALNKSDYECIAVAYAVACENGSKDHRPGSWTPAINGTDAGPSAIN